MGSTDREAVCQTLSKARASNPRAHLKYRQKNQQKCWYAPSGGRSAAHVRPSSVRPSPPASAPPRASSRRGAPTIAPIAVTPPPVVSSGDGDGTDDILMALCYRMMNGYTNDFGCPTFESRWRLR